MMWLIVTGVVEDIRRVYDTLKTFHADVIQEVDFGNAVVYRGHVYIKKPDLFKWELTEPEEYIIVAKGDSSWIKYQGELYSQPVPYNLKSLLFGDYSSLKVEERRDGREIVLKITGENVGYDSVLVFLKSNLLPKRIVAFNWNNRVEITFKNVSVNVELPDSLFRLNPP